MPKQFYGRIDLRGNEALRLALENRVDYPAGAKVGQVFLHTLEQSVKYYVDSSGTNDSTEASRWWTLSDDLFEKRGDEALSYNASGDVETITVTLPGGLSRIETITYVDGEPDTVVLTIPTLGITRTETIVKDASGTITNVTLT